ncbi:MAG: hypothetical protein ACK49N_04525 [Verrucomicrobiota bacterium]
MTQVYQHTARRTPNNPNHHIWNNNGTWWCYFTLCSKAVGSKRHRISLKTGDLNVARAKRDRILGAVAAHSGHIAVGKSLEW